MELSGREMEVLKLTAWDCLSAKEIGDRLCISPMTAQNHLKNIKDKLNLQKITELCKHYYVNVYASILLLIFLPTIVHPDSGILRIIRARRAETEVVINYDNF